MICEVCKKELKIDCVETDIGEIEISYCENCKIAYIEYSGEYKLSF